MTILSDMGEPVLQVLQEKAGTSAASPVFNNNEAIQLFDNIIQLELTATTGATISDQPPTREVAQLFGRHPRWVEQQQRVENLFSGLEQEIINAFYQVHPRSEALASIIQREESLSSAGMTLDFTSDPNIMGVVYRQATQYRRFGIHFLEHVEHTAFVNPTNAEKMADFLGVSRREYTEAVVAQEVAHKLHTKWFPELSAMEEELLGETISLLTSDIMWVDTIRRASGVGSLDGFQNYALIADVVESSFEQTIQNLGKALDGGEEPFLDVVRESFSNAHPSAPMKALLEEKLYVEYSVDTEIFFKEFKQVLTDNMVAAARGLF